MWPNTYGAVHLLKKHGGRHGILGGMRGSPSWHLGGLDSLWTGELSASTLSSMHQEPTPDGLQAPSGRDASMMDPFGIVIGPGGLERNGVATTQLGTA